MHTTHNDLTREFALSYVRENGLPEAGFVIHYAGTVSGWVADLRDDRAGNGHLTHRPDCWAVCVQTGKLWTSRGGDDDAGALRWERPISFRGSGAKGAPASQDTKCLA